MTINAPTVTEIGLVARRVLRKPRRGRIAAIFERSLYAAFADEWICIGQNSIGSGPLHVLCEGIVPHRVASELEVVVGDATLTVGNVSVTGLGTAPIWTPAAPPAWTHESLRAGLAAADALWLVTPEEDGLAAAGCPRIPAVKSRVLATAAPGLAALQDLIEASLGGYSRGWRDDLALSGLIGLGPGLTPSGDDLLGGALVALSSLGHDCTRDMLWKACRPHLECTGDISATHLRSAARGHAASGLHEAIHAVMSGRTDLLAPAIAALAAIGHSSGRDAFAGALIVLRSVERVAVGAKALPLPATELHGAAPMRLP